MDFGGINTYRDLWGRKLGKETDIMSELEAKWTAYLLSVFSQLKGYDARNVPALISMQAKALAAANVEPPQ